MKILVCVCVYDRIYNIEKWLKAWQKSYKFNAKFAICHNLKDDFLSDDLISKVDYYVSRINIGYDIGFFQDIISKKYLKDVDWDVLIWFTDDFMPMKKYFLKPFVEKISKDDVGLVGACFEPSNQNNKNYHFRTNAFGIKRNTAEKLKFPADPILSRQQSFEFEHGNNNMTIQIENMGFNCIPAIGNPYPKEGYSHWPNNDFMIDSGHVSTNSNWQIKFEEEFK